MQPPLQNNKQQRLLEFYEALAAAMKQNNIRFIWSPVKQDPVQIDKTIFIPFDSSDTTDEQGYGLYLFLYPIQSPTETTFCIIATATVQMANPETIPEMALLLHEINLNSPVPGWILDTKDHLLIFKYLFPIQESKKIPFAYLTLIAEAFQGIARSFPLLKEVIEGKSFQEIRPKVVASFQAAG